MYHSNPGRLSYSVDSLDRPGYAKRLLGTLFLTVALPFLSSTASYAKDPYDCSKEKRNRQTEKLKSPEKRQWAELIYVRRVDNTVQDESYKVEPRTEQAPKCPVKDNWCQKETTINVTNPAGNRYLTSFIAPFIPTGIDIFDDGTIFATGVNPDGVSAVYWTRYAGTVELPEQKIISCSEFQDPSKGLAALAKISSSLEQTVSASQTRP